MRIGTSIPAPPGANTAPEAARAEAMASFMALLSGPGGGETRPRGASELAKEKLSDPLGLATSEAMTSPGAPVAAREPAPNPQSEGAKTRHDPVPATHREPGVPTARRHKSASERSGAQPTSGPRPESPQGPGETRAPVSGERRGQTPPPAHAAPAHPRESASRAQPAGMPGVKAGAPVSGAGGGSGSASSTNAGPAMPGAMQGKPTAAEAKANRPDFRQMLRHERAEIAPQVAKGLASLLKKEGGSVQIQLRPEALGRVRVDLDISRGAVTARLQAETEQARELLSSEVDRLRSMLEHRGLRVERIEITSGRAERETPADPDGRGGWRTPAEDSPRDGGREAADDGSPGSGDRHRAWGGGPPEHAERDRPEKPANRAEPGAALSGAWIGSSPWRSHGSGVIRLDTLA